MFVVFVSRVVRIILHS